jgi:hypothetical protein
MIGTLFCTIQASSV